MRPSPDPHPYPSSKPWTRWWWFSGEIVEDDIEYQLQWLKRAGFGGVEIAWVYPLPDSRPGPTWLSREWSGKVAFAKEYAATIGLGCDFTFGTLWPFGGSIVPKQDASRTFDGLSKQRLEWSWEMPFVKSPGYILNHLDRNALVRYSRKMGDALQEALAGPKSALFCDSWEVETAKLWTAGFDETFEAKFGYSISEYTDSLNNNPEVRYDYRKLIAQYILEEFYKPFTSICHLLGAFSRVQCHGSPTDLLASYGVVDIPETESILFEPPFAKFAASAAALTGKGIVSCETFTCLYGWKPRPGPAPHLKREQVADMKLLADALFANGVNHIVWHGMSYNPKGCHNEFYATVHVGPDSGFADELPGFNAYMEKICSIMRRGRTFSDVAVYLPLEDVWMAGELPPSDYAPDAKYHWELRFMRTPEELKGRHPLWISGHYLRNADYSGGRLIAGHAEFRTLYVDVEWLDEESLTEILRLAHRGLPICLKRKPSQPGKMKTESFEQKLAKLLGFPNVADRFDAMKFRLPLVVGQTIPDYWCRVEGDTHIVFFANPKSKGIRYPMSYGQSRSDETVSVPVEINTGRKTVRTSLVFEQYQSVLLEISGDGRVTAQDIRYEPKTPSQG